MFGASSELAPNIGASSELASVMEFGFYWTTRGYANSRTGHLADWSTRGLANSRIPTMWTYRIISLIYV